MSDIKLEDDGKIDLIASDLIYRTFKMVKHYCRGRIVSKHEKLEVEKSVPKSGAHEKKEQSTRKIGSEIKEIW